MIRRTEIHSVVVVGPDGTGKSTFFAELSSNLHGHTIEHIHSHPRAARFHRPRQARPTNGEVDDPHGRVPHKMLSSLAKLLVVYFDWLLFYARRCGDTRTLLVIERGWYDQLVDPLRYRLDRRVTWVIRLLGRLLPRTGMVVLLDVPGIVANARKPELSPIEIDLQTARWRPLLARAGRVQIVEADSRIAARRVIAELNR